MSWHVHLFKFAEDVQHIDDVSEKTERLPLGTKSEIMALLNTWFPDIHFNSQHTLSSRSPWSEFSEIFVGNINELADDDSIYGLGLRSPSYRLLRDICAKMGWKAFDTSDGNFIDFAAVPPDHYSHLFTHRRPQTATWTLTDYIVYLRTQVFKAATTSDTSELRNLAHTLYTLGDFMSKTGDSTFWRIIDHLAYFAQHAAFADPALYIPDEAAIRNLDAHHSD